MPTVGDVVNIRKPGSGYWKGRITDISSEWTHTLKTGEILRVPYTSPIAVIKEINGIGHATCMANGLRMEDGEYYNVKEATK